MAYQDRFSRRGTCPLSRRRFAGDVAEGLGRLVLWELLVGQGLERVKRRKAPFGEAGF